MRRNSLLLLFLFFFTTLSAQTFSGKVTEKNGTTLTGVNVCLLSEKGAPVVWCSSDAKGKFSLVLPSGKQAAKIRFSLMGFKKLELPLAAFPANGHIEMTDEAFDLKEVKVSSGRIQ